MIPVGPAMNLGTEVLKSVQTFLGPGVERRTKARASAEELEHRRRALALELEEGRTRAVASRYPLGLPGRLRGVLGDGIAPCLLVSPVVVGGAAADAVPYTVADRIRDLDPSGKLLQVFTGAFVRDADQLRTIEGVVGADEIVKQEFTPGPAIVVYFETSADAITAIALVSNVVRTIDGKQSITMRLARISGDRLAIARWSGPGEDTVDLEWLEREGSSTSLESLHELSSAIAAFAVAIASVYWRLQGVRWRLPDHQDDIVRALPQVIDESASRPLDVGADERLEQELANLVAAGDDPEIVHMPEQNDVGIYLRAATGGSILMTVASDFPSGPPQLLADFGDGAVREIVLKAEQWEPCQSLVSLAKAVLQPARGCPDL